MALGDIQRDHVLRAIDEFDQVGRKAFLARYGFGEARDYFLEHQGRRYDSKAVVGAAHAHAVPSEGPLTPAQFSGGSPTTGVLTRLGFMVTGTGAEIEGLRESLLAFMREYPAARQRPYRGDDPALAHLDAAVGAVQRVQAVQARPELRVKRSAGLGNWAMVPWLALMDRRETDTTQHGVYVVFLFAEDMSAVFLNLGTGVTEYLERGGGGAQLRDDTVRLRSTIAPLLSSSFATDDDIDLKATGRLGRSYELGTIAYRRYDASAVPSDAELGSDIETVLAAYDAYLEAPGTHRAPTSPTPTSPITLSDVAEDFANALERAHLTFGSRHVAMCHAFLASLITKRFVILTGLSGSGKTQLALRFGEWLGIDRLWIQPVRPDWTGPEPLLGFIDALQPAVDGEPVWHVPDVLAFMLQASRNPHLPYALVLDEMNLAHVERYFADVLSGMESGTDVLPNVMRISDV